MSMGIRIVFREMNEVKLNSLRAKFLAGFLSLFLGSCQVRRCLKVLIKFPKKLVKVLLCK